jgi:hypothetical protein
MQFAASLTGGSFEESRMLKNVEACEWLTGAIRCLEVPNLDPYVNMRAVSYLRYTFFSSKWGAMHKSSTCFLLSC